VNTNTLNEYIVLRFKLGPAMETVLKFRCVRNTFSQLLPNPMMEDIEQDQLKKRLLEVEVDGGKFPSNELEASSVKLATMYNSRLYPPAMDAVTGADRTRILTDSDATAISFMGVAGTVAVTTAVYTLPYLSEYDGKVNIVGSLLVDTTFDCNLPFKKSVQL
jgi:hypothetical protein